MADFITATAVTAVVGAAGYLVGALQQLREQARVNAVLATKRLEILDLRSALLQTMASLERADCSEGYCCCGTLEENHSMVTEHVFKDEGTHRKHVALKAAYDVLTRCASVPKGVTK